MDIRSASSADLTQIQTIWTPVILESTATFNSVPPTLSDLENMLSDKKAFLVCVLKNKILGFAMYSQFRSGIGYRHTGEHTIIISPGARGQGIGHKLMNAIEDHARNNDFHSMFAGVSGENRAGVLFHLACGYTEVGRLPAVGRKFDRWFDLVLLQKFL